MKTTKPKLAERPIFFLEQFQCTTSEPGLAQADFFLRLDDIRV